MLKVKFLGASEGVTGSCSWLWHTDSNTQFLVDCGMHQGTHEEEWKNYQPFEFDAKQIQYVLLTHAHIDHCGLLPKLIKNGFKGWVYCTQATKEIADLMLRDAAKLNDLFHESDVNLIKWHVIDAGEFYWNKTLRLADGLSATFKRSSHVLGACGISVSWSTAGAPNDLKSIYFSGDIGCQLEGNAYLPLLKGDHRPYPKADYIVMESTYGAADRGGEFKNSEGRVNALGAVICDTAYKKGGAVLIPAFSYHRTQEIMMDLLAWQWKSWAESEHSNLMGSYIIKKDGAEAYESPLRVLCDSPLGARINNVYASQLSKKLSNGKYQYLNSELAGRLGCSERECSQIFRELTNTGSIYRNGNVLRSLRPKDRDNKQGGQRYQKTIDHYSVIIASSGMCDHGPVVEYMNRMKRDPKNTIILTGYQSASSQGRQLLEQSARSENKGNYAQVVNMSGYYSGHADQSKLLDYVFSLGAFAKDSRPANIFINHGEGESKCGLKEAILNRAEQQLEGDRAVASVSFAKSTWFDLNLGAYIQVSDLPDTRLIDQLSSIEDKLTRLTEELLDLKMSQQY
jgi:metallo-beta-lactamase family protein